MAVLPRLGRQGEKFDAIILDPPTFSRSSGGKAFQVENDFEKLLVDALDLVERDGHVLLSTNCSTLREHALEVMARYCLKSSATSGHVSSTASPTRFSTRHGRKLDLAGFAVIKMRAKNDQNSNH